MMNVQEVPLTQLGTPKRLKMSYEEFLDWANEDTHAEWVDGEVIIHMPVKTVHQVVLEFLLKLLGFYVDLFKLGQVHTAPLAMRANPDGASREPDIFFVTTEHLPRLTPDRLEGPADLIIEIISDDSVSRDREDKFKEYREAGVLEYWIIDPRPDKQRADFYHLNDSGDYILFATEDDETVTSYIISNFWLRPAWFWQAETLNALACLLEIEGVADAIRQMIDETG